MKKALIRFIVFLSLFLSVIFFINRTLHWKSEAMRLETNAVVMDFKYETLSGKMATKQQAMELRVRDLKAASRKTADSISNEYEKKLSYAYQVIEDQKKKLKNVESFTSSTINASGSDTVIYTVTKIDTVFEFNIEPFDDGYLKMNFVKVQPGVLEPEYHYQDTINTVVDRERKLYNRNGKKRFFLCRWIHPRWQYFSTVSFGNENAEAKTNLYIRFE